MTIQSLQKESLGKSPKTKLADMHTEQKLSLCGVSGKYYACQCMLELQKCDYMLN